MQNHPGFTFSQFLVISIDKESQRRTVNSSRGFNNIGCITLPGLLIEVAQGFSTMLSMLYQVIVTPVGNAFKLRPTHREKIFNIVAVLGIMSQLFLAMPAEMQTFLLHAQL